jgi:hypothetical protein
VPRSIPFQIAALALWLAPVVGFAAIDSAATAAPAEVPLVSPNEPPRFQFPQRRDVDGHTLLLHAPQIRQWPNFVTMEADAAVELYLADGSPARYGTVTLAGSTDVDIADRIVTIRAPKVISAQFPTEADSAAYAAIVKRAATREELDVPLDYFLAHLADDVLETPPPAGFNTDPPPIYVASKPTLLLFVNGEPVKAGLETTGLQVVANANWPTFFDPAQQRYYLLNRDLWLVSGRLDEGWKAAKSVPMGFERLAVDGEHAAIRAAVPARKWDRAAPKVIHVVRPAELIVTEGKPKLARIAGAEPLETVTNTESPLFRLEKQWYFLVAGRWFTTTRLDKGPWSYAAVLPDAFARIPSDHPMAAVRASVPGTPEARMAALEALLPTRTQVAAGAAPPIEVSYAGEPDFQAIPGTELARAANTGYDIIQYRGQYYLCYQGIWYVAASPVGPWQVTADVPAAIYSIPPSSPAYAVTQVKVVEASDTTVVYEYPPAYSSSVWVVWGVPYYGTGWYYPPYYWGGYYYPYWGSYGHGSWYNPATGRYGSRSVWYGPYGGYSYTQGYNPRTGRYGYVETAWDGDSWGSQGETYNPRTGVYTATARHVEDGVIATERHVAQGDRSLSTARVVDVANQQSVVQRETSGGASSTVQREWGDGTMNTSGTINRADGSTATVSGEHTLDGGQTTITGSGGQSVDMTTRRGEQGSVTGIQGSGGGEGISVKGEDGRTTIGQSGSGDLYAGHNGNVYKRTEDGWQQYENGGWQAVETPERPQANPRGEGARGTQQPADYSRQLESARARPGATGYDAQGGFAGGGYAGSRDFGQLDRDYGARQRANAQYQQRRNFDRGGFSRGGFSGGGFGGGRRR